MPQSGEESRLKIVKDHDSHHWCPNLDRRVALRLLGMTTLAAVSGCGGGTTTASATAATTGTTSSTTKLTASSTTPEQSASVTLTATVTPTAASGTVIFYDGTTSLGTGTLSSGTATLATSFSTTGAHTLSATYGGDATYASSTSASVTVTVTAATSCAETLEGEEGPYFVDDSASGYLRSNILSNLDGSNAQTGVPLTLTIYVFDSEKSCTPMEGVQVDIWHCNASGIYSAESVESTVGQSWLRGYQITDATGKVQFTTIIPGWYQGRTTHIHLRFRSTYDETDNSGTNTMQLFFDQTLIDTLSTSVSPYSAEGQNSTTNANDHVYTPEEEATTLLTLVGSTEAGYTATFNAHMPIVTA
jgi:protocatechuate 3,4-dioxygenase beta subunit